VLTSESGDSILPVKPHFYANKKVILGEQNISLEFRELITAEDFKNYSSLEQFHYKTTNDGSLDEPPKDKGGRKAILICYAALNGESSPVGYIELQMPLLMVKPRHVLFDVGYAHPSNGVTWERWNQHSIRQYVNLIVRIARVVVSPEFRGLGIAKLLVRTGKQFAKERWHIGGRRPLFMEISAEMLKYIDFVASSGFRFVGMTEGNLTRIHNDLRYIKKGYEISSGIMSLQKKYLANLMNAASDAGRSFNDVLDQLKTLTEDPSSYDRLNAEDWYLFRSVLRMPIPYYLAGLDSFTEQWLEQHTEACPRKLHASKSRVTNIEINSLTITTNYTPIDTAATRAMKRAFGLTGKAISSVVAKKLRIKASPGNIIFVAGPSGTGKSLILKALDPEYSSPYVNLIFEQPPTTYRAEWLRAVDSDLPLIEYFSRRWGMEQSINALNQAGLSEAFVYLKPYGLLSRGQRYRAQLAQLILGDSDVWLIDEFCADLDPLTASIVARNLRNLVIKYRRVAFVAAANHNHYLSALRPTKVIKLASVSDPEIISYADFRAINRRIA
jgi:ABC-type ATPase with predicted acetyltransferase domain